MRYVSTRGLAPEVSSTEALLNGIAPDGGLYVPAEMPSAAAIAGALGAAGNYAETMRGVLALFFDDVPAEVRDAAVARSVARFADPAAPVALRAASDGDARVHFLDLTRGPTGAFKDVALTLLPTLLQYAAEQAGLKKAAVLTATSGDTGSAAMRGFADVAGTGVLVFYPKTGTSEIQRRQMVCCAGGNVGACAIEGNFDDAQTAVKAVFADEKLRAAAAAKGVFLSSANSINIGRLFPQVCYYLEAWRALREAGTLGAEGFDVVVPTGNFGNVLAAFYAKRLGAPVRRFVVASNANNVVAEFIATGVYDVNFHAGTAFPRAFAVTNSPSMDILVSSNVERFVFEISGRDAACVRACMASLKNGGKFALSGSALDGLKNAGFASGFADPAQTEAAVGEAWKRFRNLIDPHTAIGLRALRELRDREAENGGAAAVVAETATPWKFPRTVLSALRGVGEDVPAPAEDEFENLRALAAFAGKQPQGANLEARFGELETAPELHGMSCAKDRVGEAVRAFFGI